MVKQRYPQSIASAAARVNGGEAFWRAFGNFLEYLKYTSTPAQRSQAFWRKPPSLGDAGTDALVAAMAEDLATAYGVA
ncbi:MAG: hypothetical protein Q7U75_05145, partial [Desulfobacterales bacterium]|nr:hypothetical protein [Desulfobacterales bacterium]